MIDDGSCRLSTVATPGAAPRMGTTLPPRLGRRRRAASGDAAFRIILALGFAFALGCIALASLT